jgi:hypothetical protein
MSFDRYSQLADSCPLLFAANQSQGNIDLLPTESMVIASSVSALL